jgi:hypothetical protein
MLRSVRTAAMGGNPDVQCVFATRIFDPKRTLRLCFSAHGKSSARRLHHMAPQIRQMLRHHFVELIKALRRYLLNNVLGQARFSAFSAKIGVSRSYFNPLFSLLDF